MDDELLHRIDEQLAHVGEHHLADTLASIAGPPGWVPDDNWAYADEWLEHNNFYPGAGYTDQTIERGPDYDWTVDHGDWNHTCDYCARRSVSRETEYEDTLSGAPVMSVNEGGARVYWAPPGEVEPPLVDSGWEQAGWIPLGVTREGSSIRYEFNRPVILGPGETLRLGRSFHQIAARLDLLAATIEHVVIASVAPVGEARAIAAYGIPRSWRDRLIEAIWGKPRLARARRRRVAQDLRRTERRAARRARRST